MKNLHENQLTKNEISLKVVLCVLIQGESYFKRINIKISLYYYNHLAVQPIDTKPISGYDTKNKKERVLNVVTVSVLGTKITLK